jgi:hypothetical protein
MVHDKYKQQKMSQPGIYYIMTTSDREKNISKLMNAAYSDNPPE